jgi:hypothetical protein
MVPARREEDEDLELMAECLLIERGPLVEWEPVLTLPTPSQLPNDHSPEIVHRHCLEVVEQFA